MNALVYVLLAASAVPPSAGAPISVTGHAWAPFISPMGEPFRARSVTDDTLADWFNGADRDHDGAVTQAEMVADAERFFATLDTDHDGQIDPVEIDAYEYELAPEIQTMSRTKRAPGEPARAAPSPDDLDRDAERKARRARSNEELAMLGLGGALQGGARYSLLNIPEPVASADADFNRAITVSEFRQAAEERFALLDSAHQGRLTLAKLEAMPHSPVKQANRRKLDLDAPDTRIGNSLPPGN